MTTELANLKKTCIFNNVKLASNAKLLYIHTVEYYLAYIRMNHGHAHNSMGKFHAYYAE